MTRATLRDVLGPAREGRYAVAGLVCLGWEDARAFVAAAEAEGAPVILQAGPGARAHMPLEVWGPMLEHLAEGAAVPVVTHLDHGRDAGECRRALDLGFTSVMFDGSLRPFAENAALTAEVAAMAHAAGASCEGEIGVVGYEGDARSQSTDPDEARRFAEATGVDALAVSAGNVHLQATGAGTLDLERLAALAAATPVPLVLHGGSGLPAEARRRAAALGVAKINLGTELRRAFGAALRATLGADAEAFDRLKILGATEAPMVAAARAAIRGLRP